jgi:hypothetical protein
MKFNRVVKVEITPKKTGKKIAIEGLRVKFNVQKTIDAALNSGTIDIYNMNAGNRAAVAFKYNLHQTIDKAIGAFGGRIDLIAGYEGDEKLLFSGDMTSAFTTRDGGDYITRISAKTKAEVLTGTKIKKTFPKGTNYRSIIDFIIAELDIPAVKAEVTSYINQIVGGTVLNSGESVVSNLQGMISKVNKRFDGKLSINIDEAGINVHGPGISGRTKPKFFYSKYTGLIGPPQITNQGSDLKVLLEPNIRISDLIFIESPSILGTNEPLYVVRSINHIGDSREGEFATSLNTWFYSAALTIPAASSF